MNPNYPQYPEQPSPDQQPQTPPQPQYDATNQAFSSSQPPAVTQYPQPQQPQYQTDPYLAPASQQPYVPQATPPNIFVAEPAVKSKKPIVFIVIIASVLLLIALAGGAYYGWKAGWFGGAQVAEENTDQAAQVTEATYDTPEVIQTEIDDVQEALDGIDDSQLADGTLSDETLNQ